MAHVAYFAHGMDANITYFDIRIYKPTVYDTINVFELLQYQHVTIFLQQLKRHW
jgi:hypothetical protein